MPDLPDVSFRMIRPYGPTGSRADGFEELVSVLVEETLVDWPECVHFDRFANPDGGREGRGVLPDGQVWAWQAKYLFSFDASAIAQIDRSVRRVLAVEPALSRYFVLLPMDLPAGDTDQATSAFTRWEHKVAEWKRAAADGGREVEFRFIGAHAMTTALSDSRQAGRLRYWFDEAVMDDGWFTIRVTDAVANAGRRYTPKLHVDVTTAQAFDGLGRHPRFGQRWKTILADLRKSRRYGWRAPEGAVEAMRPVLTGCEVSLDRLDDEIKKQIRRLSTTADLVEIGPTLDVCQSHLQALSAILQRECLSENGHYPEDADRLYRSLWAAHRAISSVRQLAAGAATLAAKRRLLLLTGRAGTGKTHLMCDVAAARVAENRPTLLFLGQHFDRRPLTTQLPDVAQFDRSLDDLLSTLGAASEARGDVGVILIDALNESEHPSLWSEQLPGLISAVSRHRHLALAVSCRSGFVDHVIPAEIRAQAALIDHQGLGESTLAAVERFAAEYGLELPSFPLLNPEFSNPLFLKLCCEALVSLGHARFPRGAVALTTIFDTYLDQVDRRLSAEQRCDYDPTDHLARQAAMQLATTGTGYRTSREEAKSITNGLLPNRTWSRSLLRGLLQEGLLLETASGKVVFGYQRYADLLIARKVSSGGPEAISRWYHEHSDGLWRVEGILGALAIVAPEEHGQELVDLVADSQGQVRYEDMEDFLQSLPYRHQISLRERSDELLRRALDQPELAYLAWSQLLSLSCVPDHPFAAQWLHAYLKPLPVANRDIAWTEWLNGQTDTEEESHVRQLLQWAESAAARTAPDEVRRHAGIVLAWFLTAPDHRVRDRSTKALVMLLEGHAHLSADLMTVFSGVNDPYVEERLLAVACGLALRTQSPEDRRVLAHSVAEYIVEGWPIHLLTRDYARRVLEAAERDGWKPSRLRGPFSPPYGSSWPAPTLTVPQIEELAGPPDYRYGSIWHSLHGHGFGDFGHYVIEPALRKLDYEDERALLDLVKRSIFEHVLALGWTPERFGEVDRRLNRGRSWEPHAGRMIERFGKKYQWIGLYEILGRLADQLAVRERSSDELATAYDHPEQLVWRDIDPSVTSVVITSQPSPTKAWFSPCAVDFDTAEAPADPTDAAGVPDPLDLIAVSDHDGRRWLILESHRTWEEELSVEVTAIGSPHRTVWLQIRSYLLPSENLSAFKTWSKGKDWFGRWMPESPDVHNVLLAAHPADPRWLPANGEVEPVWERGKRPPTPLWHPSVRYVGTGTSRDASAPEETTGFVPSQLLYKLLDLHRCGDFTWSGPNGAVIALDPGHRTRAPSVLAVDRNVSTHALDRAGMTLVWTVLAGKELDVPDPAPRDDFTWVSLSATYGLFAEEVFLIDAIAQLYAPGPTQIRRLAWLPRTHS